MSICFRVVIWRMLCTRSSRTFSGAKQKNGPSRHVRTRTACGARSQDTHWPVGHFCLPQRLLLLHRQCTRIRWPGGPLEPPFAPRKTTPVACRLPASRSTTGRNMEDPLFPAPGVPMDQCSPGDSWCQSAHPRLWLFRLPLPEPSDLLSVAALLRHLRSPAPGLGRCAPTGVPDVN